MTTARTGRSEHQRLRSSGTGGDDTARETLRMSIRTFTAAHVSPIARDQDRLETSPLDVYREFWSQGLASRFVGRSGQADRPYLADACLAAEELAYGCAAIASLIMLPTFLNRLVLGHLREPRRSGFLDEIVDAPVVTAFAATEREAGSDLVAIDTRATAVQDGYVIDGRKEYSSNVAHARYVVVVARTGLPGARSNDALTWFLVPTNTPGVEIGQGWPTLGLRSMNVSPVTLRSVHVSHDHRLGPEGEGLKMMLRSLNQSRTGIAAMAVGIARRARDEVLAYGASRRLYGDRLVKLQDYRFRIADMEKDIAAARCLVRSSADLFDRGLDHAKEASIAKLYAGQMVMRVTEAASVMMGSAGYTGQTEVEKLFRDARHTSIIEGTEPIHKELIFASVLRRGGY